MKNIQYIINIQVIINGKYIGDIKQFDLNKDSYYYLPRGQLDTVHHRSPIFNTIDAVKQYIEHEKC